MKVLILILCSFYTTIINAQNHSNIAIFAGGCFWCMEEPFDKLKGVTETTTGYTGGHKENPTYEEVSEGNTGHTEAIQITFNPEIISYIELLEVFWKNIDPVAVDEQFCDYGTQYRSGIYYLNAEQENIAKQTFQSMQKSRFPNTPITTEILLANTFYPAESNHQNYYQNNPVFYKIIRFTCGRNRRLQEIWGN